MRSRGRKIVLGGLVPAITIAVVTIGVFSPQEMTAAEVSGVLGGGGCCQLLGDDCPHVPNNFTCGRYWTCPSGNVGTTCTDSGSSPCSTSNDCKNLGSPHSITCSGQC